jgi:hypothetical protein
VLNILEEKGVDADELQRLRQLLDGKSTRGESAR